MNQIKKHMKRANLKQQIDCSYFNVLLTCLEIECMQNQKVLKSVKQSQKYQWEVGTP